MRPDASAAAQAEQREEQNVWFLLIGFRKHLRQTLSAISNYRKTSQCLLQQQGDKLMTRMGEKPTKREREREEGKGRKMPGNSKYG